VRKINKKKYFLKNLKKIVLGHNFMPNPNLRSKKFGNSRESPCERANFERFHRSIQNLTAGKEKKASI